MQKAAPAASAGARPMPLSIDTVQSTRLVKAREVRRIALSTRDPVIDA
jgi:hypothetical protein